MSHQPTTKLYDDLDFRIYGRKKIKCDKYCKDAIDGCNVVKRLIIALVYYSRLDAAKSASGADVFVAFIRELYPFVLDDYNHLIMEHDDNLQSISEAVKEKQLLALCDIRKCRFTIRHQSRERNKTSKSTVSKDAVFEFYSRLMDALHFRIMHLFDSGLRTTTAANDDDFSQIKKELNDVRTVRASLARLKESKFNISTPIVTRTVYVDELVRYLLLWKVGEKTIRTFVRFIRDYDYDTDSVKRDIEHGVKSNIAISFAAQQAFKVIAQFVIAKKVLSHSFNIGYRFFYWDYYKNTNNLSSPEQKVLNEAGISIKELLVNRKYSTFKEEIRNYEERHMNMHFYQEIMTKVEQYLNTDLVKQMKATRYGTMHHHYGIKWKNPLLARHLLALFLYTDLTWLCTHFSSTFRKIEPFEPLQSVRSRNAKYFFMSKCLRECVELFGGSRWGDDLSGPFYCGLSLIMPVPSAHIRLCAPTSCSKQMTVAMNFAGDQGLVLEIDNRESIECMHLHGFSCSTFSDFAEEAEVLFFGGLWNIEVISVQLLEIDKGYRQFMHMFYYLDMIVTGAEIAGNIMTNTEVKWLKSLINYIVFKKKGKLMSDLDGYIQDTFSAVTFSKTYITLKFMELRRTDRRVRNLLMHPLYKRWHVKETKREANDKSNLFKPTLLKLFPNVKSIFIESTARMVSWSMSMVGLLAVIKRSVTVKQVIVQATNDDDGSNWIKNLWDSDSTVLKKQYRSHGYNISVENIAHDKCQFDIRLQNSNQQPETEEKKESDSFDDMLIEDEGNHDIQQTGGEMQVVPTPGN